MAAQKGNKYACKYTDKEMDKLCAELIEWSTTSKSIHLSRFSYDRFKKSAKYLYEISRSYPKFKDALEQAKDLIGMKITDTCWIVGDSGANPVFGEKYLPVYSQDYKDMLAWKAQLVKEKESEEKQVTVNVTNYGDKKIEVEEV